MYKMDVFFLSILRRIPNKYLCFTWIAIENSIHQMVTVFIVLTIHSSFFLQIFCIVVMMCVGVHHWNSISSEFVNLWMNFGIFPIVIKTTKKHSKKNKKKIAIEENKKIGLLTEENLGIVSYLNWKFVEIPQCYFKSFFNFVMCCFYFVYE